MVVGEPTLMGGEFGDEDERLITRLENQQFEPNSNEEDRPPDAQNMPGVGPPGSGPNPGNAPAQPHAGGPPGPAGGMNSNQGPQSGGLQGSPSLHSPWHSGRKTPQAPLTPADEKVSEWNYRKVSSTSSPRGDPSQAKNAVL